MKKSPAQTRKSQLYESLSAAAEQASDDAADSMLPETLSGQGFSSSSEVDQHALAQVRYLSKDVGESWK